MKLFLGGLSWDTDEADLQAAFEPLGGFLSARIARDKGRGSSRGFGFVTFRDAGDARAAVAEADGAELDGRQIRVNEAEHKGGPGGGMPRGGAFSAPPARDKWGTQAEDDVDALSGDRLGGAPSPSRSRGCVSWRHFDAKKHQRSPSATSLTGR